MEERRFKLVLLGTTGVGKTCLTLRFVKGLFDDEQLPTIGAAYMTKKVACNSRQYIFELWDTAGQERYEAITPLYYRSAEAAVIVFDITDPGSLNKAKEWLKRLKRERDDPEMPIVLAGNKCDAPNHISRDAIDLFIQETGLKYFETSAKTGDNVDEMFVWIARNLPTPTVTNDAEDVLKFEMKGEAKKGCC